MVIVTVCELHVNKKFTIKISILISSMVYIFYSNLLKRIYSRNPRRNALGKGRRECM